MSSPELTETAPGAAVQGATGPDHVPTPNPRVPVQERGEGEEVIGEEEEQSGEGEGDEGSDAAQGTDVPAAGPTTTTTTTTPNPTSAPILSVPAAPSTHVQAPAASHVGATGKTHTIVLANLELSHDKLNFMCPQFASLVAQSPPGWRYKWTPKNWADALTARLKKGDLSAALVVSLAPLRVFAYSPHHDNGVLLAFPDRLTEHYGLEKGQLLHTVNVYHLHREVATYPVDLQELGPDATGKASNFDPHIAEFLGVTDHHEMIQKGELVGRLRQRVESCAQAWVDRWGLDIARNGLCLYSLIPAPVPERPYGSALGIPLSCAALYTTWPGFTHESVNVKKVKLADSLKSLDKTLMCSKVYAAVVLEKTPFRIGVYNPELDSTMVLDFPVALGYKHQVHIGQRFVAVAATVSFKTIIQANGSAFYQKDMFPGPRCHSAQPSNAKYYIPAFITGPEWHDVLKRAVDTIPPEHWNLFDQGIMTWNTMMGGTARTGHPLWCFKVAAPAVASRGQAVQPISGQGAGSAPSEGGGCNVM